MAMLMHDGRCGGKGVYIAPCFRAPMFSLHPANPHLRYTPCDSLTARLDYVTETTSLDDALRASYGGGSPFVGCGVG